MIFGADWPGDALRAGRRGLDTAVEASIVGSFSKVGYNVRSRLYRWQELPDLSGKTVIITGATSGLGKAAASELSAFGADIVMIGRNRMKTQATALEIHKQSGGIVEPIIADLCDLNTVGEVSEALANSLPRIDALIHNAGVVVPDYTVTQDGFETTFTTHVLAPHVLTRNLLPILQRTGDARVITMTSGGMYTERLDPETVMMTRADYDGLKAYARAKRAQVVMNQQWAYREPSAAVFHTVHPGWAATPGVEEAHPRFYQLMRPLLRDPYQGADTMVWLAAAEEPLHSSGLLWLDRHPRALNKLPWTRTGSEEATQLWEYVEDLTKEFLA